MGWIFQSSTECSRWKAAPSLISRIVRLLNSFNAELGVNIYDPQWAVHGGSKAKRLRYFLRHADRRTVLSALYALWEYREATNVTELYSEVEDSVLEAFFGIIERLGGTAPGSVGPTPAAPRPNISDSAAAALARRLVEVSAMNPQARGYAFEKFPSKTCSMSTGCLGVRPSV